MRQPFPTIATSTRCIQNPAVPNLTLTRRQNALALFQAFAEQAFLALALKAWRATNAAGRKALRQHVKDVASSGPGEA